MLIQNLRKSLKGTTAKIVVALMVIPFALFGVESLLFDGGAQNVAEVNGEPISAMDLQQQINQQKRRLLMSMGDSIDPTMLDDQILAGPAIEFLVQKKLLLQSAEGLDLAVSDENLNKLITAMPAFLVDGKFDQFRYQQLLQDQGYTPASFRLAMREDVLMGQLRAGVSGAEFATPAELEQLAKLSEERRDIRYLTIPIERFKDASAVADEEIQAWYETNESQYQTTETVDLDYIELGLEDFPVEISEVALLEAFELQKNDLVLPEERFVSHILFEPGSDESASELQARIAAVKAKIEPDASNFADLAKDFSEDLGSANFGGELGYTSGDSFPPEVEAAVLQLAINQVSEPVESEAGWHLLLVTDIQAGSAPSFEEMRTELELQLSTEESRRELIRVSEQLRDLVFNAEDLSVPARDLDLEVERIEGISRSSGEGLFDDQRVRAAAYSNELLVEGYNSEVIEVADNRFLVFRVAKHHPAELKPLAEVRVTVIDEILEDRAQGQAAAHADKLLRELRAGADIESLAHAENYEWQVELAAGRGNANLPRQTVDRIFELEPPPSGSVFDYVQAATGDIDLFEIFRVSPGNIEKINDQQKVDLSLQMADQTARMIDQAMQNELASKAEVVRS